MRKIFKIIMAIWKGTALVSSIVGKLGANIFQRWKNKNVVKSAESSVSNPNSAAQEAIRDALGFTSSRWASTYTAAQKATWDSYAQKSPGQKKTPAGIRQLMDGNTGIFFGLNAAIKVNTQLIAAGLDPVDVAPLADSVPGLPLISSVSFTGEYLIITWDTFDFPADSVVRVWIDSQQELFHKQILVYAPAGDETISIASVRAVAGAALDFNDIIGSTIFLQLDCISPAGAISRAGNTIEYELGEDEMIIYLAVRVKVINLAAQAVAVGDTDLDLSASIPAGAHTAIILGHLTDTAFAAGNARLDIYESVVRGVALAIPITMGMGSPEAAGQGHVPLSTARHVRYAYATPGTGEAANVEAYLIGYII